jgi:hypothetical protein
MKKRLKLGFTDYFKPIDQFFMEALSSKYEIERDDQNPDYLIFCDDNFGRNNLNYDMTKVTKILYTGENRRPWEFQTHHAIGYDHLDGPLFYRLPLYVVDNWVYTRLYGLPDIREITRDGTWKREGFCSFVVMNGSCKVRNDIYHYISKYKRIDSGGPLFNNMGGIISREPVKFHTDKFEFLKKRKFNLCYENGLWPGYVTEKIYHALYCNTIPIYWGSPTIEMDFNIKAIISRHDFPSDHAMLDFIKEVDYDNAFYNHMVSMPVLNPRNNFFDLDRFVRWFDENVYKS